MCDHLAIWEEISNIVVKNAPLGRLSRVTNGSLLLGLEERNNCQDMSRLKQNERLDQCNYDKRRTARHPSSKTDGDSQDMIYHPIDRARIEGTTNDEPSTIAERREKRNYFITAGLGQVETDLAKP